MRNFNQKLLKSYIGVNYNFFHRRHFNLPMFLFSFFYLFYRKMILAGLLLCFIYIAFLNLIVPHLGQPLPLATAKALALIFLINFILAFLVNRFYLAHARRKIAKIRTKNPDLTEFELLLRAADHGRTSVSLVVVGSLLTLVIIVLVTLLIENLGLKSPFQFISDRSGNLTISTSFDATNPSKSKPAQTETSPQAQTYSGTLSPITSIDIAQDFTLTAPNQFDGESTAYQYLYTYSLQDTEPNQCQFSLFAVQDFHDAKSLINQMAAYGVSTPAKVDIIKIHGLDWYWFASDDNYSSLTNYYYATNRRDTVYLFNYQVVQNDESPGCADLRPEVLNSIKPVN